MNRWLRVVLPDWIGWLDSVVALKAIFVSPGAYALWITGQPNDLANRSGPMLFFLLIVGYAIYRVWSFHPAFQNDYRRWLLSAPWTSRQPLPLGPVHLVGQDAVVVGVLTWLACWPEVLAPVGLRPVWFAHAFVAAYLFALAASLRVTGAWLWAYAAGFGLGLGIRLWHQPVLFFAVTAGTYALAYFGLQRSLAEFPWNLNWLTAFREQMRARPVRLAETLGWPFGLLTPKESDEFLAPRPELFCLAGLAAWWLHVALALIPDEEGLFMFAFAVVALVPAGLIAARLLAYIVGYYPPLSFVGRLLTRRLIIPGYDKIFVAPLLAMLASWIGVVLLNINPVVVAPLTIAVVVLIIFGVGPRLKNWRLTGAHRIVPRGKQGLERVG